MFLLAGTLFSALADKHFYLDPGSGSFLIQLLIAGLAGIGIVLGSQWRKIKKLFKKKKAEEEDELEDKANEQ